ncbi:proteasome subunit beta type-4-like [Patiria miniata]|uniref:Proteasome subunit beta n=1 Tax=Patiria miniata TaxID=46514 RepID=A0A914A3C4_PATMI|nr:proteasome subunit beta type-4-like [Patiria miniata]
MASYIPENFWQNGPRPGAFYSLPGNKSSSSYEPAKHTLNPMVTGTSVLGIKFNGGVLLAADMLGSYGSMARFRNISRIMNVNNNTAIAGAGDYADFQFLKEVLEQRIIDDECLADGHEYTPKSLFSWLTRVMYNRRSKFNPLWNVFVVGGVHKGEPFLGYIDKIGTAYESPTVASGFGAYIALPLMRDAYEKNSNMSEAEARAVLDRCMKVLFYRDARSFNKYEYAVITSEGVTIEPPTSSKTNWDFAYMVEGYE